MARRSREVGRGSEMSLVGNAVVLRRGRLLHDQLPVVFPDCRVSGGPPVPAAEIAAVDEKDLAIRLLINIVVEHARRPHPMAALASAAQLRAAVINEARRQANAVRDVAVPGVGRLAELEQDEVCAAVAAEVVEPSARPDAYRI